MVMILQIITGMEAQVRSGGFDGLIYYTSGGLNIS
jgi:hypothetical protein